MTDPRIALNATFARWLRVRAQVRASANRLAAQEYALGRDAAISDDPAMAMLLAQLQAQRRSIDTLGSELDDRLAIIQTLIDACGTQYVSTLAAGAHRR